MVASFRRLRTVHKVQVGDTERAAQNDGSTETGRPLRTTLRSRYLSAGSAARSDRDAEGSCVGYHQEWSVAARTNRGARGSVLPAKAMPVGRLQDLFATHGR